jgi:probable O-glycosylation ligase (exosortase A-associated)
MAYYTLTTFFAWVPDEAWEQWRKVMKIVLMTFVATMFIYGKDRIYALMLTVALSIGFYGVKGFFFVLRSGGAEHVQGPEGSFITGNTFLGLALTMVLPVMVCLAREEERRWLRNLLYSAAAMTGVSTVFTYSRGAFLGLGAVLPLLFVRSKRKWLAVALLVPALFIVPALLPESVYQRAELIENYETDRSANMRLQSWTVAWNLARDNPLTGAGFNFEYGNIRDRWLAYGSEEYEWALRRAQAAHSIYFQVLGQHGFVALGLFLALLVGTWAQPGPLEIPRIGASGARLAVQLRERPPDRPRRLHGDRGVPELCLFRPGLSVLCLRGHSLARSANCRGARAHGAHRTCARARSAFELRPSRQPRYGPAKSPDAWAIDKVRRFARPLLTLKRVRHGQDA